VKLGVGPRSLSRQKAGRESALSSTKSVYNEAPVIKKFVKSVLKREIDGAHFSQSNSKTRLLSRSSCKQPDVVGTLG
jgi:hypothetical protein